MSLETERIELLRAALNCDQSAASALLRQAAWRNVARNEFLMHQGDEQRECYIVLTGSADLKITSREGQCWQIATIEPGEIFGAYPEQGPVRADVQARNAMKVVSFDVTHLSRFACTYADVGAGLARIFARQFDNVLDRFGARITLTAVGRVYSQLSKMAGSEGILLSPPSVAALALRAQTTRETASRALGVLERRCIMRRDRGKWTIVSARLLDDLII